MKSLLKKISKFFRMKFNKSNKISIKELVLSVSMYDKKLESMWEDLTKILNDYERKKLNKKVEKNSLLETMELEMISHYESIVKIENDLVTLKVIKARINANSFMNNSMNQKIYFRAVYMKRCKEIKNLIKILDNYNFHKFKQTLKFDIDKYQSRVNKLTIDMDKFNERIVSLPFIPFYS